MSGARGTTDIIEIPSHFTELFLTDYSFVKQFALMTVPVGRPEPGKQQKFGLVPISKAIFDKMIFCDQVFENIELEESLYFTALDVEFHSASKAPFT